MFPVSDRAFDISGALERRLKALKVSLVRDRVVSLGITEGGVKGVTGENLLTILESRLDNVIYRLGFCTSRAEARQLVLHGHFDVNGKRVDIPSYLVTPGEVISLRENSKKSAKIKEVLEITESKLIPDWLELNRDSLEAKVVSLAKREHIDLPIEEHLIVELYSKN